MNIDNNFPTTIIAGACFTSPAWLPSLEYLSSTAAKWAPILGGIWLLIQIINFFYKMIFGGRNDKL